MYPSLSFSESKAISKKNRRSKCSHYCKVHKTRGLHLIDSTGKISKEQYGFELLRNRKDFENLKKYNIENPDNKLSICKYWSCQCHYCKPIIEPVKNKFKGSINDCCIDLRDKKKINTFLKVEDCSICLEPMKNRKYKRLGCGHELCLKCYDKMHFKDIRDYENEYKKVDEEYLVKYGTFVSCDSIDFIVPDYSMKCPLCRSSVFNNRFDNIFT